MEREFRYTHADFEQVRQRVYQMAGISLAPSKDQLVYSRLVRRLRTLRLLDFPSYFHYLDRHAEEAEHFINALTTNLTSFFREEHHFDYLAQYLREHHQPGKKWRIWCSAASTGEEPYSIAMTLAEAFGRFDVPVELLASDIDTKVLATAREGVYPESRLESVSAERRKAFFLRGKQSNAGRVRVVKELRQMIEFRQINLLDTDWRIKPGVDVIFCRNVMIYFDKATQHKVLGRMAQLLSPQGRFFAGHSESFVHANDVVRLIGRTIYQPVARR
ncbi:CheR family methyltransferase [Atopomonas sediminilitoris]|uniref:CheR family methyltransferase n=1 Tax=Atopomonas sediminilitoris TaxID=2919919 RepID=UPI001F4EF930|nr:CheR family methyltransferase [Atopomonas sediminilitoris]MCJ8170073.1 chemotaxis protein CheR [Atopomonas sediminilitoris]